MNAQEILGLYLRDSDKLYEEISAYTNEADLWQVKGTIANSAGNLCLHLVGNLNHFIGATLGKTGYVRNRDHEFNGKDVPRTTLLNSIREAQDMLRSVLPALTEADLSAEYPYDFGGKNTTRYYLVFFMLHFNYHLGQINYHRRSN